MIQTIVTRYISELDRTMREITDEYLSTDYDFSAMPRYAMGWIDEAGHPYNKPTGKRLRPTLLLLCNEAAGGNWNDARYAAAAVEILHNFSLIHDDIQDDSDIRHGRPTVWKLWGQANAINAGDAMFTLAYEALQNLYTKETVSAENMMVIWKQFNQTNLELTRGQHLDIRFETLETVPVEDYISMIKGKTGALLAFCGWLGAFTADFDRDRASHFEDFGLNIGIAFQIRDDILGIWGDSEVTGKSAATDIVSRKKSLPVLYGLSQSSTLTAVYERADFNDEDVQEAVEVLNSLNAREYAVEREQFYYDRAMQSLEAAKPQGEAAQLLQSFVDFLFSRDY